MKKNKKQIITGIIIFTVTLIAGFGITVLTFSLFDTLSRNQMRFLFALDIILLIASGGGVYLFSEAKKKSREKKELFEKRHNGRVAEKNKMMSGIYDIIESKNFAA